MIPGELNYVCDGEKSGIKRRPRGKGYEYFDASGRKITSEDVINRINQLVIPPNWEEVWICEDPYGHLQATGYDQKKRKQYLYHEKYSEFKQKSKYRQLADFGLKLPKIRYVLQNHLNIKGWPKEKVLALVVKILDQFYFRIGNRQYQKENETFGATTLRRKHISTEDDRLVIQYKAKSGKYRKIDVKHGRLRNLIKETSELPGYEVFRYLDDDGKYRNIDSQDVNTYIRDISDEDFTAKDFRTWGGTVTTLEVTPEARKEVEANPRKKLETAIIRKVAKRLGNTVSTCREYYIHPKILDIALSQKVSSIPEEINAPITYQHLLRQNEKKVLNILSKMG